MKRRSARLVLARTEVEAGGLEKSETTSSCREAAVGLRLLFERRQCGNSGSAGRLER